MQFCDTYHRLSGLWNATNSKLIWDQQCFDVVVLTIHIHTHTLDQFTNRIFTWQILRSGFIWIKKTSIAEHKIANDFYTVLFIFYHRQAWGFVSVKLRMCCQYHYHMVSFVYLHRITYAHAHNTHHHNQTHNQFIRSFIQWIPTWRTMCNGLSVV